MGTTPPGASESERDMSRSKGKATSRATEWSQWEWNSGGYWESWRYNSRGGTEWRRDPPASSDQTPRTYPLVPNTEYYSSAGNFQYDSGSNANHAGNHHTTYPLEPALAAQPVEDYYPPENEDPARGSSSSTYQNPTSGYQPSSSAPPSSPYDAGSSTFDTYTYDNAQAGSNYGGADPVSMLSRDFGGLDVSTRSNFPPILENQACKTVHPFS